MTNLPAIPQTNAIVSRQYAADEVPHLSRTEVNLLIEAARELAQSP